MTTLTKRKCLCNVYRRSLRCQGLCKYFLFVRREGLWPLGERGAQDCSLILKSLIVARNGSNLQDVLLLEWIHFLVVTVAPPSPQDSVNECNYSDLLHLHFFFIVKDITSLLHTIYEVVDASVNHSPSSSKTLRVKLSVTPDASQRWRNGSSSHANAGTCSSRSTSVTWWKSEDYKRACVFMSYLYALCIFCTGLW